MRVIVRHPDGREYAVLSDAVPAYEALGFAVVGPERPLVLPSRRKRAVKR